MLLLIDNYDSFTYNLAQYLGELGAAVKVVRNDAISVEEVGRLAPERIVISPGPCTPNEAGVSLDVIRAYAGKIPLLGVCLGHQAIGAAMGGAIVRAQRQMHGKASTIETDEQGVDIALGRILALAQCAEKRGADDEQEENGCRCADEELGPPRHAQAREPPGCPDGEATAGPPRRIRAA